MRSFVLACISAIAIAAAGAFMLNEIQEPVSVAYSTQGVHL